MNAVAWRARLGQRIVVCHRLPGDGLTEVIGELTAVDTHLRVRTRSGDVAVPLESIVAGKVVPPRPARKGPAHLVTSITDLQAVMSLHWRPEQTERHGAWLLRASGGFTNRGNSVLPLGDPRGDVAGALADTVRWYDERGLPPQASVAGPVDGGVPDDHGPAAALRTACTDAGWRIVSGASADVMTAPTADLRRGYDLPDGLLLDVADQPDGPWLDAYRYRGQPLPPHALHLLSSAPAQVFVSIRDHGTTVGVARGSLGGGWAGVTAVEVDPAYRRRGLGSALLRAIADWAWRAGATSTYLQVSDSNETARRLYAGAGFALHHHYDYWRAPVPA